MVGNTEDQGDIEYSELIASQMAELCMSEKFSDVTFDIQNEKIPGHIVILAARSEYFRGLLFGGLAESKQKVIELDVPIEAFKTLLTYIYSGQLLLSQLREDTILDILGMVNQYVITELQTSIPNYLLKMVSLDNVCAFLDTAILYSLEPLKMACLEFMDSNANEIITHETFKNLSEEALKEILQRDSFFAPEDKIFSALSEWCNHNPNVPTKSVMSLVRLPIMDFEQLFKVVRHSGFLDPNILLDAIEEKTSSSSLPYRGALYYGENVAIHKFGARVIEGEYGSALLDTKSYTLKMDKGYAQHPIVENTNVGIIVELGSNTIINHIKMLLFDRDNRCYTYFIEVSVDKTQWERVIDYRSYPCYSWQFLYFPSRVVRYIKLLGVGSNFTNAGIKMFQVVSLEAYYKVKIPKIINGAVAPTKNVATYEMRARSCGESGDIKNYHSNTVYTHHQIGAGSIRVLLAQPYHIGSMRLLLWDCDERDYYYIIETSCNGVDWSVAVDKRNEACRSWQNLVFEPRVVLIIKITGTKNTITNSFACVHFECPSQ